MAVIRLEALPSLAETVGMETPGAEVVADEEIARGYSVRMFLNRLADRCPRLSFVFDPQTQKLSGQVTIFLNDRNLELVDGLETRLQDGDTLTFIPFIEGG